MPSAAVTRIRQRIGDMGLPAVVWMVEETYYDGGKAYVGFYDREQADAYAHEATNRIMIQTPLRVLDAGPK